MIDKKVWMKYSELKAEIIYHDHMYYGEDAPTMSDREYDTKLKKLQAMEEEHPYFVSADSPTQGVGHDRFAP